MRFCSDRKMRDPRPGLGWSHRRLQTRARYAGYMDSQEWWGRRERWLAEWIQAHGAEPVCTGCGGEWTLRTGDLHHRTYARLGRESWRDLMPLCRRCHRELHRIMESVVSWRRLGPEQASDLIAARLRGRKETTR